MMQRKIPTSVAVGVPAVLVLLVGGFLLLKVVSKPKVLLDDAIVKGDNKAIANWVNYGINYNDRALDGGASTPLTMAASKGLTSAVKSFVDHGANVNMADVDGITPLMWACDQLDVDSVKLLLDKGADVNAVAGNKKTLETALMRAATADPGLYADRGMELYVKTEKENIDKRRKVVQMLLDHKADPDKGFEDAAFYSSHDPEIANMIVRTVTKLNSTDREGRNLLFVVDDTGLAAKILASGVDINATSKYGETALMQGSSPVMAEFLIAHGAKVNLADHAGKTAMHHAVDQGPSALKKIDVLLAHGADIAAKDKKGWTPVFLAKRSLKTEVMDYLLKKGAVLPPKGQMPKPPQPQRGRISLGG